MTLRKGKTKQTLESSINSTLLAVEVYNKPRTPFRVENYISLMIMAWTRLFHAHFNNTIGDKYYYKNKKGTRYRIIDGEKKAWDLKKCISEYGILDKSIEANLIFFIKLRNKIEHRHIEKEDVGIDIFGECQALLYNYEKILVELFGEKWAINENLAHSLQFSTKQTKEQEIARKKALSKEVKSITEFIKKYRSRLDEEVFNSQEFSVKLIQIPKILNNPKDNVPSIEFVNWSRLNEEDKKDYKKVTALIKDRVREVISPGKLKPGDVIEKVNKEVLGCRKNRDYNFPEHC